MKIRYALIALAAIGCSRSLPESVSIDPRFAPEQRAAALDAIDSWCEAVGWCPSIVTDGELHVVRNPGLGDHDVPGRCEGGFLDRAASSITIFAACIRDPGDYWHVFAHEFGHLEVDKHTPSGVMAASYVRGDASSEIDAVAIAAWEHGAR